MPHCSEARYAHVVRELLQPAIAGEQLHRLLRLKHRLRLLRVDRLWPAGDSACILQWSFRAGDSVRCALFGRITSQPDDVGQAPSHQPHLTRQGISGVYVRDARLGLTVHSADRDPWMDHLAACLDVRIVGKHLSREVAPKDHRADMKCRLLGYKPGRRATLMYSWGRSGRVLAKTYGKTRAQRLTALHQRVNAAFQEQNSARVRVQPPRAYLPEIQLALFDWANGSSFGLQHVEQSMTAATDVLSALHSVGIDDLPNFSAADENHVMRRWLGTLAWIHPRLAAIADESLCRLLKRTGELADVGEPCVIHRDFYEKQFVVENGTATLLDLDTLARGHRAVDLGNFLGHLLLCLLRSEGGTSRFTALARSLLEPYERTHGTVNRGVLHFYLCSSLWRLGAIHAFRTRTRCFAARLWQLADDPPPID